MEGGKGSCLYFLQENVTPNKRKNVDRIPKALMVILGRTHHLSNWPQIYKPDIEWKKKLKVMDEESGKHNNIFFFIYLIDYFYLYPWNTYEDEQPFCATYAE